MGYGPVRNGRHEPITPYAGSWAEQEARRRAAPRDGQWPLGHTLPKPVQQKDKER